MANEDEVTKLAERQLDREMRARQKTKELELEKRELEGKVNDVEAVKEKVEKEMQKVEKDAKKLKNQSGTAMVRSTRAGADLAGSLGAQTVSAMEEALLNYLIKTFPDQIGKYKVIVKAFPPLVALGWYLAEALTLKDGRVPFGKEMRLTASNVLSNLGFNSMVRAYLDDRKDLKTEGARLGQTLEEQKAMTEAAEAERDKLKKMLKDRGVEVD